MSHSFVKQTFSGAALVSMDIAEASGEGGLRSTNLLRILAPQGDHFELDVHGIKTIQDLRHMVFENWPKGFRPLFVNADMHHVIRRIGQRG